MRLSYKQKAVYWAPTVPDGFGNVGFSTPVEINVRWEDKIDLFINKEGKEQRSSAVVYPESILKLDGYLYLGQLALLTTGQKADPKTITTAKEIRGFSSSPSLKATSTFYKAWL